MSSREDLQLKDVISAKNLWKIFGRNIAIRQLSLTIPPESVFLIMGPNGSGKSTFLKTATGLIRPTRGEIKIFGSDPWRRRHELFKQLGVMFEDCALPDWASGKAFLRYMARLKRLGKPKEEALAAAGIFGVDEYWNQHISTYSSGMKRKLALANAFLGDPELVILDDPTVALDKQSRLSLEEAVVAGIEQGKTYVIASHIITEFESHATHLMILNQGRSIVSGTIRKVTEEMMLSHVSFKTDKPEAAAKILIQKGYALTVKGNLIIVEGREDPDEITSTLKKQGMNAEIELVKPKLWDLYIKALTIC